MRPLGSKHGQGAGTPIEAPTVACQAGTQAHLCDAQADELGHGHEGGRCLRGGPGPLVLVPPLHDPAWARTNMHARVYQLKSSWGTQRCMNSSTSQPREPGGVQSAAHLTRNMLTGLNTPQPRMWPPASDRATGSPMATGCLPGPGTTRSVAPLYTMGEPALGGA